MPKEWKKYFGQKSLSEVTMDEFLGSLGLYRKLTAKDATCLFRAISEQVFACQIHHMAVRKTCVLFMRRNQKNFESHVEGSFEKYLERLGDPQESAGQLEISAFSLIYNRDFIVYRQPGEPPSYTTENGFEEKARLATVYSNLRLPMDEDVLNVAQKMIHMAQNYGAKADLTEYVRKSSKILLYCSSNGHYDSVYTKQFHSKAAICQSLLYEILYKHVFNVDEEELRSALEMFRSGAKKTRSNGSVRSENAPLYCLPEKMPRNSLEKRMNVWEGYQSSGNPEEKYMQGLEEAKVRPKELQNELTKRCLRFGSFTSGLGTEEVTNPPKNPKMPFPFKVLKALDPDIYRNVEFDVWLDSRKEFQKLEYLTFAGRQYFIGDKCQARLETGGRYYSAHVQDVKQDNMVTVFVEELAEKHVIPVANLRPMPPPTPFPAWSTISAEKGGNYPQMPDMDVKSRNKPFRNVRGKEGYMTMDYSREHPPFIPRLQHGVKSGRPSPAHFQNGGHTGPYEHYYPKGDQRSGRGYGMARGSGRFLNRNDMGGSETPFYPAAGKRCYPKYDNFSYRSRSYSRNRRHMQPVNKEYQHGFSPDNGEDPQGLEEATTYYEAEEGDDTAFPPLVNQDNPTGYWVATNGSNSIPPSKQGLDSSEQEPSDNGEYHEDYLYATSGPGYEDPGIYSTAESTANLSLEDSRSSSLSSQEGVASYGYPQKVMVNSAGISSSSSANPAPVMVFSSSTATDPQVSMTTPTPQNAVQPILVTPSQGRPVVIPSMPYAYQSAPVAPVPDGHLMPPYSCDPNCSDLPQDPKIVQHYFNLGLQYCQHSFGNPVMYVSQVPTSPHMEVSQACAVPVPTIDPALPPVYTDIARNDMCPVHVGATTNGSLSVVEHPVASHGTVYYPVVPNPYNQPSPPGYESCIPLLHTCPCGNTLYHVNQSYVNSAHIHPTVNPSHIPQVGYMASSNSAPHFGAQNM